MSSVKLPVDFVGQEVEMGFASKKKNCYFFVVWGDGGFLRRHDMKYSFCKEIFLMPV